MTTMIRTDRETAAKKLLGRGTARSAAEKLQQQRKKQDERLREILKQMGK